MEKKKMTKKAAIELLKDRKVYVNGKSADIQMKLFELGFIWDTRYVIREEKRNKVTALSYPFLYTSDNVMYYGSDMINFTSTPKKEISYDEILAIEVEPDCPFKPFDKVLVKVNEKEDWRPDFFARYIGYPNDFQYECIRCGCVRQCIKYEENKHLLNTFKSPEE